MLRNDSALSTASASAKCRTNAVNLLNGDVTTSSNALGVVCFSISPHLLNHNRTLSCTSDDEAPLNSTSSWRGPVSGIDK